MKGMELQ